MTLRLEQRPWLLLAALAVTLAPAAFFVVPGVLAESHETPAEALAASADASPAAAYAPLLLQLAGAVLFLVAALGILLGLGRRRPLGLRLVAAAALVAGGLAALPLLGMELAQVRLLHVGDETEAMVDLAVRIQEGAFFGVLLLVALLGFFAGVLLLAVNLWRAGVIPPWPLLLFPAPIVVAFLPLPGRLNEIGALLVLLVPLAWISRALWALPEPESRH